MSSKKAECDYQPESFLDKLSAKMEFDGPALFEREHVVKLLRGKRILFVGDSNMRAVYRDVVGLVEDGTLGAVEWFTAADPASFKGDRPEAASTPSRSQDGRDEVRQYEKNGVDLTFAFVPKTWSCEDPRKEFVWDLLRKDDQRRQPAPDLVVMLSAAWDLTRSGPGSGPRYVTALECLAKEVERVLPPSTFLWLTYPPVGCEAKRGLPIENLQHADAALPFAVIRGNQEGAEIMRKNGIDVLDLHFYLQHLGGLRAEDGIHWNAVGVRLMTNLILTHVCAMWKIRPPSFKLGAAGKLREVSYDKLIESFAIMYKVRNVLPSWFTRKEITDCGKYGSVVDHIIETADELN